MGSFDLAPDSGISPWLSVAAKKPCLVPECRKSIDSVLPRPVSTARLVNRNAMGKLLASNAANVEDRVHVLIQRTKDHMVVDRESM